MTDADPPKDKNTSPPARQIPRLVVSSTVILAVVALLIFALRPGIEGARSLLPLIRGTAFVWALAAVACQAVMYLCIASVLRAGLGAARDSPPTIPSVTMAGYAAAFLWANRALPGPAVAGLATLVFLLGRRGIGAASAQAAAATFYVADYVAFAPLSVIVIVLLSQFSHLAGLHSGAMFIALGLVGAGMVASIVILKSPRHATSVAAGAARFVATVFSASRCRRALDESRASDQSVLPALERANSKAGASHTGPRSSRLPRISRTSPRYFAPLAPSRRFRMSAGVRATRRSEYVASPRARHLSPVTWLRSFRFSPQAWGFSKGRW